MHDSKLPDAPKKAKSAPVCPSAPDDSPHSISMHKLATIRFSEETDPSTKSERRICPSCLKGLSNSSKPVMMQKCGHVLCMNCVTKFLVVPNKGQKQEQETTMACFVCDTPVTGKTAKNGDASAPLPPGLVALKSEGTGFSARGSSVVERPGVAFQC